MNRYPQRPWPVRAGHLLVALIERAWIESRILRLKWAIHSTEQYLIACALDGLDGSLMLREFRRQMATDRAELAVLMNHYR